MSKEKEFYIFKRGMEEHKIHHKDFVSSQPASGSTFLPIDPSAVNVKEVGIVTAKDLQTTFSMAGKYFSEASCKFIVRLFDLDKKGGLDIHEFDQLYENVKLWVQTFNCHDRHRTGFLDEKELAAALKDMNIEFSSEFIKYLLNKSDKTGKKMSMDKFIITCIQIQKYADAFKNLSEDDYNGTITLNYANFLETIMKCL